MLTRRVIACLDVRDGRVVKGVGFENLRDVGEPAEMAERYEREGADEIVFLDISATLEGRATFLDAVRRTAERLFVPLTVGGGIRTAEDGARALRAGADKVSLNTAAIERPESLRELSERFGAQCVVASIDARREGDAWRVLTRGGTVSTGLDAVTWARECVRRGAGEILLTSIDRDGARTGYDLELTRAVSAAVDVPVVASGGAGSPAHVSEVLRRAGADAALLAGVLHDGVLALAGVKAALRRDGVPVRGTAIERTAGVNGGGIVFDLERIAPGALVTVVTQDARSGAVLMLAWADREALERTLASGEMHYRSRTRGPWHKGATSGNTQRLVSLAWDCDADTVLARVVPAGPACHEGRRSCFGDAALAADALGSLDRVLAGRADSAAPAGAGYTRRLLADRNLRLKKLGEEAAELAVACADGDRDRAVEEAADLVYHVLVALRALDAGLDDVRAALDRRAAETTR